MRNLLFFFILPFFHVEVVIFVKLHLLLIQNLLFPFISTSNIEVVVFVHFTFFACRSFYYSLFHDLLMQKLLFLFISSLPHAKVVILIRYTFLLFRSCSSHSICIPSIQNFVILVHFIFLQYRSCSPRFDLPVMQKMFFLFVAPSSHAKVVILVHGTFPCRNCGFC